MLICASLAGTKQPICASKVMIATLRMKAIELEQKIFAEIVKVISENAASLKITSNAIASLDTLISFAEVALETELALYSCL